MSTEQAAGPPAAAPGGLGMGSRPYPAAVRTPVRGRIWREFAYLLVMLPVSTVAVGYLITVLSLSAALLVTLAGCYLAAVTVLAARGFGTVYRSMARSMLGIDVPAPLAPRAVHGFWRRLLTWWADPAGWRTLLFGLVAWPLSIVGAVSSISLLGIGLGGLTHWLWYRLLPAQLDSSGQQHHGASFGADYFIDTTPRQWLLISAGVLVLVLWCLAVRGFARLFRALSRSLLGPTAASLRVAHLERTRRAVVQDAEARLRRIERDLHDGTQARLVTVAMQIGDAKDQVDATRDPQVAALLAEAHAGLKHALTELREIARGIHPPALDDGLTVALTTLAARSALPVAVQADLPHEPDPEIQAIAYYAVSELLSNAARHSGAQRVTVEAKGSPTRLALCVRDDGRGGAAARLPDASGGTGLAGLSERAAAVDGRVGIDSPAGGPTVITVTLPMSTR